MKYLPEIDAQMMEMWSAGSSAGQIGFRLGMTRNAVIGRLYRLGAPKRSNPNARVTFKQPKVKAERAVKDRAAYALATDTEKQDYDAAPFVQENGEAYTTATIPTFGCCRWISGMPSMDAPLCGHPVDGHSSYCEHHRKRCSTPMYPHKPRAEPRYG